MTFDSGIYGGIGFYKLQTTKKLSDAMNLACF